MILNAHSNYSELQRSISDMCRALAIPARVAILEEVAKKQNCMEEGLVEVEGMAAATVKEHLKELKRAGLIKGSLLKSKLCYCVNWEKLDEFKRVFDALYEEVKQHRELVTKHNGKCIT